MMRDAVNLNLFPIELLCRRLGEVECLRMPGDDRLMIRARKGQFYLFDGFEYREMYKNISDLYDAIDLYVDGSIVFA